MFLIVLLPTANQKWSFEGFISVLGVFFKRAFMSILRKHALQKPSVTEKLYK